MVCTAGVSENTLTDEADFELSWFVLPEFQGQGFAAEITRALLGGDELGGERMAAETRPKNPA